MSPPAKMVWRAWIILLSTMFIVVSLDWTLEECIHRWVKP
jgi:hypothetical protein